MDTWGLFCAAPLRSTATLRLLRKLHGCAANRAVAVQFVRLVWYSHGFYRNRTVAVGFVRFF